MSDKRVELKEEMLESVTGGSIVFNPQGDGNYYMQCEFSGAVFHNVSLANIMNVIKYASGVPNTPEGEQQIIAWAQGQGII